MKQGNKLSDRWGTPWRVIRALEKQLGVKFTLDPCAEKKTAKAKRFFTIKEDGLAQKWSGHVFVNPPYSPGQIIKWVRKAREELKNCKSITMLLTNDSSTVWYTLALQVTARLLLVSPRIQFDAPRGVSESSNRYTSHVFHMRPGRSKMAGTRIEYLEWEGNPK